MHHGHTNRTSDIDNDSRKAVHVIRLQTVITRTNSQSSHGITEQVCYGLLMQNKITYPTRLSSKGDYGICYHNHANVANYYKTHFPKSKPT